MEPAKAGGELPGFTIMMQLTEVAPAHGPSCQLAFLGQIRRNNNSERPSHHPCELTPQAGAPRSYGHWLDVHVVVGGPGIRRLPPPLIGLLSKQGL